ncbi:MAG: hypothetical protein J0H24_20615, partial [Delftia acidovorans]|nr:hypothetical protein [Delftia acidovorans]
MMASGFSNKEIARRVTSRSLIKDGNPAYCAHGECRDQVLLDALDARIGSIDRDTVLVLHQIGRHTGTIVAHGNLQRQSD